MSQQIVVNADLTKPATVFIQKVSAFVGGVFEPIQIKRVAAAQAKADLIKAQSEIEVTDLQKRALHRFVKQEERRQKNIEAIAQKALPLISENAKGEQVDDDWLARYFNRSRDVSNEEMQQVWAKVLSGEFNNPGTFSAKTLDVISNLSKKDAESFHNICRTCWNIDGYFPFYSFLEGDKEFYERHGIKCTDILDLRDCELIRYEGFGGFAHRCKSKKVKASYFGRTFILDTMNEKLDVGHMTFTKAGEELRNLCDVKPIDGFVELTLAWWKTNGVLSISPVTEQKEPPHDGNGS